jgi:DNA-damage-inducible protein J
MQKTTNLNIRIDKDLKQQAEVFFNDLGINMTTAFNIFVRQSLRQGKIPFEIGLTDNSPKQALKQLQTMAQQNGTYKTTMDEIDAEISKVRGEK